MSIYKSRRGRGRRENSKGNRNTLSILLSLSLFTIRLCLVRSYSEKAEWSARVYIEKKRSQKAAKQSRESEEADRSDDHREYTQNLMTRHRRNQALSSKREKIYIAEKTTDI
jgi:hypothetical protein